MTQTPLTLEWTAKIIDFNVANDSMTEAEFFCMDFQLGHINQTQQNIVPIANTKENTEQGKCDEATAFAVST